MNEPEPLDACHREIDLMRQIDAVCRQFEAHWRAGASRPLDNYLADVPDEARAALRAELEALERELRPSEETAGRAESSPAAVAPTVAPLDPPTSPIPGMGRPPVHEEATLPPSDRAQSPYDQLTAAVLGQDPSVTACASEPTRVRYFGDYEIVREIARGGMGVVFQARQMSLNRLVALKMILAGQLANEADILRFRLEAEAAGNLDHPGIVPIFEVGHHEGQHYFSMGFVDGQSLSQRLADGPLPSRQAAGLMLKVTEAVEYAHQLGVVHRDLKPGNILLDRSGNPRVTDFGLAKKVQGDSGLTTSGQIMGTPSYMAPEQAGGKQGEVGPAADVYALGSTLYCVVTGRPPFQAANAIDTVIQVVSDDPVPPRRLNPTVEHDLETICLKCLEKVPAKRYASAAALGDDLRRYLGGEPIVARPVSAVERLVKLARRRPAITGLAAALVLATLLGVAGIVWQWRKAEANFAQAETNLVEANLQRGIAQERSREATEKAQSLERQLYSNRINLAQREWMSNSSFAAEEILNRCPPTLRDWEWSYVRRLCHLESLAIPGGASGLAFSPDGHRVASADAQHRIKVWDVIRGDLLLAMTGHSDRVYAVAFSPDGRLLASGSQDTTIKIWDASSGTLIRTLEPHGSWIRSLAFSPDGTRLVSGSGGELFMPTNPAEVILWDVATGRELRRFAGRSGDHRGVAYRPDGAQIASACEWQDVRLWDAETGVLQRVLTGHAHNVESLAYSPDGRTLASAGRDHVAVLWDVASGRLLHTLRGHDSTITGATFSPDGKTLVTADNRAGIKVWDVSRGAEVTHFRGSSSVNHIQFSPDGRFLATVGGNNLVTLWETSTLENIQARVLWGHRGWCFRAEYTRDGRTLATTGWGLVRLWDASSGRHMRDIETGIGTGVYALGIRPDGRVIATAQERGPKHVDLWDVATGRRLRSLHGHAATVKCLAFAPDGRFLASAGDDQTIRIWDSSDGRPIAVLKGHTDSVDAIAFSPDGKWLASQGLDSTVRLWDVATKGVIHVQRGVPRFRYSEYANSLAFSPDSRRLAAARSGSRVSIWDVETWDEVLTLSGHGATVNSVAFLSDRRVVTTSNDRTVKLWDIATGEAVLTLRGHSEFVLGLACHPDGTQFTTTGSDESARVWETVLPSPEARREARLRARVESLYEHVREKAKVALDLRADSSLSEPDRAAALRLVEALPEDPTFSTMPEDPALLNNTSWSIAVDPRRTLEEYRSAVRQAEAACRLAPQESTFLNTLGVARYRAGQYREAVADLSRSVELNAPQFGGPIPADLAFLALAQHRLGQSQVARETLGRLREVMKKPQWAKDQESQAFLREAEAIELDLALPADPFAP